MMGSGMSVGKMGPFIQISGCICENMPYKKAKTNMTIRQQFLVAAFVIGMTSSLGAPIGGLFFAMEVCTT